MAAFTAIAAAAQSLERLLTRAFAEPPAPAPAARAQLVRTVDFAQNGQAIGTNVLSVFLYRVAFNTTVRAGWSAAGSHTGRGHAPLDLHFLLTPWAANPEHELAMLGRAVQCLEETPTLAGPLLVGSGGWADHEAFQIVPEELTVEAVMRTFDSLPTDYRLSLAYVARVVRIDTRRADPDRPVSVVDVNPAGAS